MNTSKIIRCFIALELPVQIQETLGKIIGQLKRSGADVKWVDPANIHLTMKFLGEIPESDALRAGLAINGLKGKFKAIDSGLGILGAFPSLDRPKVIWAGLSKGAEEIKEIQREIEKLTGDISEEEKDRKFSPHLTLGRVRSNKNIIPLKAAIKKVGAVQKEFRITRLSLIKSTLTREGAIYSELNGVELR
jgi:2'-5' RNA ligase